jgi:hypothetical protein
MKASVLALVSAFLATTLAAPVADPKGIFLFSISFRISLIWVSVINPYQNEINAADRNAVLGDVARRGDAADVVRVIVLPQKRGENSAEIADDEKAKRGEDDTDVIQVISTSKGGEMKSKRGEQDTDVIRVINTSEGGKMKAKRGEDDTDVIRVINTSEGGKMKAKRGEDDTDVIRVISTSKGGEMKAKRGEQDTDVIRIVILDED